MKWLYKFISSTKLFSPNFWALVYGFTIFILIIVCIIAYGHWIPQTKTLDSLNDFPLKLPANFADFPSTVPCTWAILSYGS
jgi:hypothetical protein